MTILFDPVWAPPPLKNPGYVTVSYNHYSPPLYCHSSNLHSLFWSFVLLFLSVENYTVTTTLLTTPFVCCFTAIYFKYLLFLDITIPSLNKPMFLYTPIFLTTPVRENLRNSVFEDISQSSMYCPWLVVSTSCQYSLLWLFSCWILICLRKEHLLAPPWLHSQYSGVAESQRK